MDSSGYEGGIGAAAVLYKGDRVIKSLQLQLGPITKHTIYESEIIGILLTLHLLTLLRLCIFSMIMVGLDNQPVICALNNQESKPAHHLLDLVHTVAE